ncbi:hypothetical protein HDU92_005937, partial [Lobulomyces angularis]
IKIDIKTKYYRKMNKVNTNRFSASFRIKKERLSVLTQAELEQEQLKTIHFDAVIKNGETTRISLHNDEKNDLLQNNNIITSPFFEIPFSTAQDSKKNRSSLMKRNNKKSKIQSISVVLTDTWKQVVKSLKQGEKTTIKPEEKERDTLADLNTIDKVVENSFTDSLCEITVRSREDYLSRQDSISDTSTLTIVQEEGHYLS